MKLGCSSYEKFLIDHLFEAKSLFHEGRTKFKTPLFWCCLGSYDLDPEVGPGGSYLGREGLVLACDDSRLLVQEVCLPTIRAKGNVVLIWSYMRGACKKE